MNRFVTSNLHPTLGTCLTIDETQLKFRTSNSIGIHNVQIFRNTLEWKKVEYDFKYYTMDMSVDIKVCVLLNSAPLHTYIRCGSLKCNSIRKTTMETILDYNKIV